RASAAVTVLTGATPVITQRVEPVPHGLLGAHPRVWRPSFLAGAGVVLVVAVAAFVAIAAGSSSQETAAGSRPSSAPAAMATEHKSDRPSAWRALADERSGASGPPSIPVESLPALAPVGPTAGPGPHPRPSALHHGSGDGQEEVEARVPLSRFGPAFTIAFALVVAGPPALADEPTKQECVEANESAQDLQRASKLVEAREHLRVCAAKACPRAVRVDCAERLDAIEKALPTVVLTPRDAGGGAELGSATLAIDGATLPEPLDGTPVSVDPGTHTFTVSLAGRSPVSLRLSLNEGDAVRREVVL